MVAALALAATLAAAPVAPVATFALDNGVRVYVQRMSNGGMVIVRGTVALSPAFDPAGKEGTGAVTIALLHAHADATYDYGAHFSATVPAARVGRALATLAAGERNAAAMPAALAQAVDDETQQAEARASDATVRAQRAFDRAVYGNADPLVRVETARSLAAIVPGDVTAYVRRYFVPQNTTLVIVGDVDPRAVRGLVTRAFGGWPKAQPRPDADLPPAPAAFRSVSIVPGSDETGHVRIGQATLGRLDPDFYALTIVNAVLAARIAQVLPHGTSALLTTRRRGVLAIDFPVAPDALNAARDAAKAAVARVMREAIPASEWNAARARLLASPILSDPSPAAAVARAENIALNGLPVDYFTRIAGYYAVRPAAGLAAARRHLHADTFAEVIVTSAPVKSAVPSAPSP